MEFLVRESASSADRRNSITDRDKRRISVRRTGGSRIQRRSPKCAVPPPLAGYRNTSGNKLPTHSALLLASTFPPRSGGHTRQKTPLHPQSSVGTFGRLRCRGARTRGAGNEGE